MENWNEWKGGERGVGSRVNERRILQRGDNEWEGQLNEGVTKTR